MSNTAVKRIFADVREMKKDPSDQVFLYVMKSCSGPSQFWQYYAAPLDDNLFDWHFTIRGPRDTPFEGGVYHGRVMLPHDYPFKPPNIMFLTVPGSCSRHTTL